MMMTAVRALRVCVALVILNSCTMNTDGVSRSETAENGPDGARVVRTPRHAHSAPAPAPSSPAPPSTPAALHGLAQVAYIKASSTEAGAFFGISIALFEDTLVVGAPREGGVVPGAEGNPASDSKEDTGAVYVFGRKGSSWTQQARLEAPDPDVYDVFGESVALFGDTLAVGAGGKDRSRGAVYVFRRTGSSWTQEAYLVASHRDPGDHFGVKVALAGNLLAVSAPGEASTATGIDGDQAKNGARLSGAVYIFRRTGSSWVPEAYLKASNAGERDGFGLDLALSGDTLAVGACRESSAARGINGDQNNDDAPHSGAVYVFRRTNSSWVQEAYIKASNADARDFFGRRVALSGDTLAVGAPSERSNARTVGGDQSNNDVHASGAVYVFRRTGSSWAQEAYLKASNNDAGDVFGSQLALAGDLLAVGAWNESSAATGVGGNQADNRADASGAVYMFRRTGSSWAQTDYIKASNTGAGDRFGDEIALSPSMLAIGTPYEDSAATGVNGNQNDESAKHSGAVYLFH